MNSTPIIQRAASASPTVRTLSPGDYRLFAIAIGIVLAVLSIAAGFINHAVNESLDEILSEGLTTILEGNTGSIRQFVASEQIQARLWADSAEVRDHLKALLQHTSPEALRAAEEQKSLRVLLQPLIEEPNSVAFGITDPTGLVIAASEDAAINQRVTAAALGVVSKALKGENSCVGPMALHELLPGFDTPKSSSVMLFAAPIQEGKKVVAVFITVDSADVGFSRILAAARFGKTGESYAYNAAGRMLSGSRFESEMRERGLLTDPRQFTLRDPGGNLFAGFRPPADLASKPLIRPVMATLSGQHEGIESRSFRDYRGVKVLGAWQWLPELGFGVVTQIDHSEVSRILRPMRIAAWGVGIIAVGISCAGAFYFARTRLLNRRIRETMQLGQYTLEEKIGEGGLGVVYRARHALLRRATAIKLLREDMWTPEMLARFEREVQITSQLTHPNTIEIYDFGRTPADVFYYAMELIEGVTLARLIDRCGPQPVGRVIAILRQACGSLAEAHSVGFIHRDIKPLNLMLCVRGGLYDFVKVLDFGLVKETSSAEAVQLTQEFVVVGTPLYVSPERLLDPNRTEPATDIYAIGSVAFELLTGRPVFAGQNPMILCQQVINAPVPRPRDVVETSIPPQLDALVFSCLAKDPKQRPADMLAILAILDELAAQFPWTREDAHRWWETHRDEVMRAAQDPVSAAAAATQVS